MRDPSAKGGFSSVTVEHVVEACMTLPEPGWHRIVHDHPEPRPAATLVPIVDVGGRAAVIVTLRAASLEHGGDWVFPGGGVDHTDSSHLDAARRDASEELGVSRGRIEVVGQLATRGPIVSGFVIEAYVGIIAGLLDLQVDADEVADVAVVAIDDLLRAESHHRGPARTERRLDHSTLERLGLGSVLSDLRHYRVRDEEFLWGLQADILYDLLHHVTGGAHEF